jgi:CubicO group peptidase (beta-lactamase class C family)
VAVTRSPDRSVPGGRARGLLEEAIRRRVFPGAVLEVGTATRPLWTHAVGTLSYDVGAAGVTPHTIFDLASLTKVLATTPLYMQLVERGVLGLDDAVTSRLSAWSGSDRASVTIRDLLSHCGGLSAWAPLYREHHGRAAMEAAICGMPLEYEPRTRSVYSDLGFILLGFILENGDRLDRRFAALAAQMSGDPELTYTPPPSWAGRTAPTEEDPWRGRRLIAEVHDENAAALGGVAAHAGLFGTAAAVGTHARHLLQVLDGRTGIVRPDTLRTFVSRRTDIPGSSRALGWDTALPTSSCSGRLSARAFGHTGFTGTSLWIDPERGAYVVLLTNRVHPTRDTPGIREVRPRLHDAVFDELDER